MPTTGHGTVILAIDPSSTELGAVLFSKNKLIDGRCFKTKSKDRIERSYHLIKEMERWADSVICGSVSPRWWDVVYESPSYFTPKQIGAARPIQSLERFVGMLEFWSLSRKSRVFGYNVSTVKNGVVGRSNASKEEMEIIMKNEYNLHNRDYPSHVWDALGVATYHLSQLKSGLLVKTS